MLQNFPSKCLRSPIGRFLWLLGLLLLPCLTEGQETNLVIAWQRSFGGNSVEYLRGARPTSDGGFVLGGSSASERTGNKTSPNYGWLDYWVIRLDADGNKIWEKTFGGSDEDSLTALEPIASGGFILGGSSVSPADGNKSGTNLGSFDYWVVRLDANGNKLWERTFGGDDWDSLESLQPTADGGFIVGGSSSSSTNGNKTSPNLGNNDFWIIRLNGNGEKLWERSFGGNGDDSLQALQQTADGGFIVGGSSASTNSGNKTSQNFGASDFWVLKLDSAGNKIWERSFGGNAEDRILSLQQTVEGGYILAGESWSGPNGNKTSANYGFNDFWVVRLDAAGNKTWDFSFGGLSNERAWSVQQVADGGFVIGGRSGSGISGNKTSAPFGSSDYWMVRLDSAGGKLWERCLGGSDYDELYRVGQIQTGYFLAGESSSTNGSKLAPSFGQSDFWLLKLSQGPYRLVLTTNGPGRGSISANPSPGPTGRYENGTVVTLTPVASAGYQFVSWGSDLAGTNKPAQVTMDRDKVIMANFISTVPAVLSHQPKALTNFVGVGQPASPQTLQIWNGGGSTLSYTLTASAPWLSVAPSSGTSVEETNLHAVALSATNLAVGHYRANIILSAGVGLAQTVSVVTVVLPIPRTEWQRNFGARGDESLNAIVPISDGGFLLGGSSDSSRSGNNKTSQNFGSNDFWIVRMNALGDKEWDNTFGGRNQDILWAIRPLVEGGFILAGSSESGADGNKSSPNFGSSDFWIVRVDAGGNRVWDKSFGGAGDDVAYAIQQTADGGFIVGGESSSSPGGNKTSARFGAADYWLVRLDAGGNKLWERSYGGNDTDQLTALQLTGNGGCVVAGHSLSAVSGNKTSVNFGNSDIWLLSLDAGGNKLWEKSFGGSGSELAWVLEPTFDQGFMVGGESDSEADGNKSSPGFGDRDFWILKLDAAGNKIWDRSFGGSDLDSLFSLRQSADGGFFLGGGSTSLRSGNKNSANFGQADFWLVRLDAAGTKLWDQSFGGTGYDELYALELTADGGVVAGGLSESPAEGNKTSANLGAFDFWLLKLAPDGIRLRNVAQSREEMRTQGFRFLLEGVSNLTYVIDYATNRGAWSVLRTNTLNGNSSEIIDPASTNGPRRFYRARLAP